MTDTVVAHLLLSPPYHDISNDDHSELILNIISKLRDLNFTVLKIDDGRLTVSASKSAFEQAFLTMLELRQKEISRIGEVNMDYYAAVNPVTIPETLSSWIGDIVFPIPPDLFSE